VPEKKGRLDGGVTWCVAESGVELILGVPHQQ